MASADKDGRVAQLVGDLAATTVMAVNEALLDQEAAFDLMLDQIRAAEAEALARHQAGTCHESEWSCSHCEASRMSADGETLPS